MAASDLSEVYGEHYYEGYYERSPKWFAFFNQIADCLVEQYEPEKHLDAGCAWGLLVEVLRERGVQSFGIDFSSYALERVHPDIQPYCRRASLTEPIEGGPYDVVTCIEVLEHMEEADALRAIENLTAVTDVIVFSSTPDGFDDPTHINLHPLIYWLRAFARHGFYPQAESDAAFVSEHAFVVQRAGEPDTENALRMFAQLVELRAQSRKLAARLRPDGKPTETAAIPDDILTSPAWRLISRYRAWLEDLKTQRPGLFSIWERAARLALKPLASLRAPKAAPLPADWDYADWIARNEPSPDGLAAQVVLANDLPYRPRISVVTPVYKISREILGAAIDSLTAQTYDNWELCASVIPSLNPTAAALLRERAAEDPRIRVCALQSNLGISGNSNEALAMASGEFIALLDHDDTLAPFALYETALLLNQDPAANFIYSDRDEISQDGLARSNPFFKPGWSPEILMSANYLTHICVVRSQCLRDVGGWRSETDGAQDWDLFLRLARDFGGIRHIPKILYHWRHAQSSVSTTGLAGKPFAKEGQVRTIESYCRSANLSQPTAFIDDKPKILWRMNNLPPVTVIVVSRGAAIDAAETARQIAARVECAGVEVVCPAFGAASGSSDRVKFVSIAAGTDIVASTNQLAASASGELLVFVDAGVQPASPEWLPEMLGPLLLPGVGLSGCHITDARSGRIRHIGIAFDDEGNASAVRGEIPAGVLHGWNSWLRNWSAASGACFAIRRSTWDDAGGLSAPTSYSRPDVRLCLKLAEKALRIVTNPMAQVRQAEPAALELPLRAQADEDRRIVRAALPQGDPYINPNLRLQDGIPVPR